MSNPVISRAKRAARSFAELSAPNESGADRGTQQLLALQWNALARDKLVLPFRDVEFRNYSQNGEDGILLYLFTLAGHGSRRAVEMCAGDAIESNAGNLVMHHDWHALMIDGSDEDLARGEEFYARQPETRRLGPTLSKEWITVENADSILEQHGFAGDLDLFSLDMDGVDYWILESISATPRVLVVEYNNRIPAGHALTVPYEQDFVVEGGAFDGSGFFGASLSAFVSLLGRRNYRLVGSNRHNTNAFFLREDVLPDLLPEVPAESCLNGRWAVHQQPDWPSLSQRGWVDVNG